jgi:hypothetical protein
MACLQRLSHLQSPYSLLIALLCEVYMNSCGDFLKENSENIILNILCFGPSKHRSGCSQSANGWITGLPMEELEKVQDTQHNTWDSPNCEGPFLHTTCDRLNSPAVPAVPAAVPEFWLWPGHMEEASNLEGWSFSSVPEDCLISWSSGLTSYKLGLPGCLLWVQFTYYTSSQNSWKHLTCICPFIAKDIFKTT